MRHFNNAFRIIVLVLAFAGISHTALPHQLGVSLIPSGEISSTPRVKLLVIGISKYRDIPSLMYADKDACLFYNYMISPKGGNVSPENARLLLNEQASASNILNALDSLLETAGENETLFVYFNGHSAMDTVSLMHPGFLLCYDCPKSGYMAGGTVQCGIVQQYLETIASKNGNHVFFIADAVCSVPSSAGEKATCNVLQDKWKGVTKILSSSPGESAWEGKQYNNGGGVFTYYLLKGLCGLADINTDGNVSVSELNIYLISNVPKETRYMQNPVVIGEVTHYISKADTSLQKSLFDKCK